MRAVLGAARHHAHLRRALEQKPIQHLRTAAARSDLSPRHGGSDPAMTLSRPFVAARNIVVLSRDRDHQD